MEGGQQHHEHEHEHDRDDWSSDALPPPPPPPPHMDLPLPPGHGTFIVQFPKDMVYRVPPRENAIFMERIRNQLPNVVDKKKGGGSSCCCCSRLMVSLCLILVALIAAIGITLASLYFIYNPKPPTFSVTSVTVKKGSSTTITKNNNKKQHHSPPKYEISLRAHNPNNKLTIDYDTNANVTMMFDRTRVATTNKFPLVNQASDDSRTVKIELIGTKGPLPKLMEKSMMDGEHTKSKSKSKTKTKTNVALKLEMKLGIKMIAAGLHTWVMKSDVVCHFKVDTLGGVGVTQILSQTCETNFTPNK